MAETIFMSLTLALLVYIAYVLHKVHIYTQYVLVAITAIMTALQEIKQWLEGEEDDGETQQFHQGRT